MGASEDAASDRTDGKNELSEENEEDVPSSVLLDTIALDGVDDAAVAAAAAISAEANSFAATDARAASVPRTIIAFASFSVG